MADSETADKALATVISFGSTPAFSIKKKSCDAKSEHPFSTYPDIKVPHEMVRNVEYSILLVMSELSIVRCDRVLGLWIAGTRASSVDGELPWRCCGRWTVRGQR